MEITHKKVVTTAQNPAFEVSKDEWNDLHEIIGGGGGSLVVTTTDQTANREFNTIYQNTTGKPMLIVFDVWCGAETIIRFNIGDSSPPTLLVFEMSSGGVEATHEASILMSPNWYYNIVRIEEAYIQRWIEQTLEIVGGGDGGEGSIWYSGSDAPASELGADNDYYLDYAAQDIYRKIGGAWTCITNITDIASAISLKHQESHTLGSHSTKAHSELSDIGADDHHASGNIKDSVLGLKTGIKAGTNVTITDDSGYAKIAASGGGGGTPSDTVVTEKTYDQSEAAGSATTYSRGDHTHGTPVSGGVSAHDKAYHNAPAIPDAEIITDAQHGTKTTIPNAHHPSGNINDYTLGLKAGIKAGTGITITDDSGYAKIDGSGGGGGADFSNYRHYGTTQYEVWYTSPKAGTALVASALVANTLYAIPFVCPKAITLDRIGINVTTLKAGAARLGIYADAGGVRTCYPGTLLLDAGTVDTGTVGVKSININQALTGNTLYWLVIVPNVAPSVNSIMGAAMSNILGQPSALTVSQYNGLSVAFTYAPLPATFPTTTTTMITAAVPGIFVRLSA
jgi:hypothetical protein